MEGTGESEDNTARERRTADPRATTKHQRRRGQEWLSWKNAIVGEQRRRPICCIFLVWLPLVVFQGFLPTLRHQFIKRTNLLQRIPLHTATALVTTRTNSAANEFFGARTNLAQYSLVISFTISDKLNLLFEYTPIPFPNRATTRYRSIPIIDMFW